MRTAAAYFAERFPLAVFAPAIALHAGLAWSASGARPNVLPWVVVLCAALIVQYRLWDDLEDVERDRQKQPARVLPLAPLVPFRVMLALLLAACAVVFAARPASLVGYAMLCVFLLAGYRVVRPRVSDAVWRYGVLLLKYPAIVLLIGVVYGASSLWWLLATAGCSYAVVCAYEAWHHDGSIARLKPRAMYAIERSVSPHPARSPAIDATSFEIVPCLACGTTSATFFIAAEDDLTGKPGRFEFVACSSCGLVYQQRRLTLVQIRPYYDGEYIAHQPSARWGVLAPLFRRAIGALDRAKLAIVRRHIEIGPATRLLDVGCGSGAFLAHVRRTTGAQLAGVDFVDLSAREEFRGIRFHYGAFYEQPLAPDSVDIITMWHFLEHDYEPRRSLAQALSTLCPGGLLVVEVPRLDSLSFRLFGDRWPGLQAPQHTALYDRAHLVRLVESAGFEEIEYLPFGAFPPYFYLFCGVAFRLLRGRGLNIRRAMPLYFAGQLLLLPVLPILQRVNFAMQTVICRKPLQ